VPALKDKEFETEQIFKASRDGQLAKDFHRLVDGKGATVTFGKLTNNITVAGYTSVPWNSQGLFVKDTTAMIINLTNKYNLNSRDHDHGGIFCSLPVGPSFGNVELRAYGPFLGEGMIFSCAGRQGYMIGGALKQGDFNPITQDKVTKNIKNPSGDLYSKSTAKEIEVWLIKFTK
jgi:hypothetical protein